MSMCVVRCGGLWFGTPVKGRNTMWHDMICPVVISIGPIWGCDTAALIDVNAAQSKLVLLENFNENYSKCLRLLYKVNAAEGVNAASKEVSTAELIEDSDAEGSFDAGHDGRKNKDDSHSTKKRRICSELQQQEAWQSL
ncbi:hypothetical protein Tco_1402612 [Tanacetum coccineum]